jgi:hypothetical protein
MSSWKIAVPLVAALLGVAAATVASQAVAAEAPFSRLVMPVAAFGCTLNNGQLVCGIVNGHKNKNQNTDGQGDVQMQSQMPCPQGGAAGFAKSKKSPCQQGGSQNNDVGSQGARSCPPGYVVLDKPNKYGAFCEPKEGLPTKVDEASCAQKGLTYIAGGDNNACYCPEGYVNKGTGLLAATSRSRCVTVESYNNLQGVHSGPLRTCCDFRVNGQTYAKCEVDPAQALAEAKAFRDNSGYMELPLTCAPE